MKLLKKFEEYVQDMMSVPTNVNFSQKSGDEIRKEHEIKTGEDKGKVLVKFSDVLRMNTKQFKEYLYPFLDTNTLMPEEGYDMLPEELKKVYLKELINMLIILLPNSQTDDLEDWELKQLADAEKMYPEEFKKVYLTFVYDSIKSNDYEEFAHMLPRYIKLLSPEMQLKIVKYINIFTKKTQYFSEQLYNAFSDNVKEYIDKCKKIKVY